MKKSRSKRAWSPSEPIDARIEDLGDGRGRDALPAPRPDHEGDKLDEKALKALLRAAVALNKFSARG